MRSANLNAGPQSAFMNSNLLTGIQQLDDYQANRLLQSIGEELFHALQATGEQLQASVPDAVRVLPAYQAITGLTPEAKEPALKREDAGEVARGILLVMAQDEALVPALEAVTDECRDDWLAADVILAAGSAASMILIAARTSFTATYKNVEIGKETASAELVGRAAELVGRVSEAITGAGR